MTAIVSRTHKRPDKDHHDTKEMYGLKLPKIIPHSQWSQNAGTAGCDPLQVRVTGYLYKGASNYTLRLIANGRFVILEGCRSTDEHWLVSSILRRVRDKDSAVKLGVVLKQVAADRHMPNNSKEELQRSYHYR